MTGERDTKTEREAFTQRALMVLMDEVISLSKKAEGVRIFVESLAKEYDLEVS